jgi:hypothetical protein
MPFCTPGTTSHGCVPNLTATGTPSVSASSGFVLTCTQVEGQRNGITFYGITGEIAVPWGSSSSFLCIKAPRQRTPAANSGGTLNGCDGMLSIDFLDFLATHPNVLGQPFMAGQVVYSQTSFRDPFGQEAIAFSNGLKFTMVP